VLLAFVLEGGHLGAIVQVPAMILVVFGTIGAATVTTSMKTVFSIPNLLRIAFFGKERDATATIEMMVRLAEKARRDGLLPLEEEAGRIRDGFLRKAIYMVVDGTDPALIKSILETEMAYISERHRRGALLFQKLGGFSPTLGILGTVLGLIHTLSSSGDADQMARSIAAAFIATLWGVGMANLLYLPLADKLKFRHEHEEIILEMILEGTLSIQAGENPRVVRSKLEAFLPPKLKSLRDKE